MRMKLLKLKYIQIKIVKYFAKLIMIIELFIIFFIFTTYFFFYLEYKINKNNKIYEFDKELTRQNINNEVMLKMPFYFDGSHLTSSLNISNCKVIKKDKKNNVKEYSIIENELMLLKPYIKCNLKSSLYGIKNNGQISVHANTESVNYYFAKAGSAELFLIHPRFKDNFETEQSNNKELKYYIENNEHFHKLAFNKGTIVYVPNNWMVYIKNVEKEDCYIEKISYSSLINKFMSYFKKNT